MGAGTAAAAAVVPFTVHDPAAHDPTTALDGNAVHDPTIELEGLADADVEVDGVGARAEWICADFDIGATAAGADTAAAGRAIMPTARSLRITSTSSPSSSAGKVNRHAGYCSSDAR